MDSGETQFEKVANIYGMSVGKQILTAPVRLLRRKSDFAQYSSVIVLQNLLLYYQNNVMNFRHDQYDPVFNFR